MIRHILVIALAVLVSLSVIAHADAGTKSSKKVHASLSTITITKHDDKASPVLF